MQHAANTQREEEVTTTVRLSRKAYTDLQAIAKREHRSFSGELRLIVDRHIEANAQSPFASKAA